MGALPVWREPDCRNATRQDGLLGGILARMPDEAVNLIARIPPAADALRATGRGGSQDRDKVRRRIVASAQARLSRFSTRRRVATSGPVSLQ
jgi:hypothetical protein